MRPHSEGTIIKKDAVFSRRADLTDVLFIVADLRSVWVTANVTESDVAKLPTIKDGAFRMSATAYPGREFRARLLSRRVQPSTRQTRTRVRCSPRPRRMPTTSTNSACSCASTSIAPRASPSSRCRPPPRSSSRVRTSSSFPPGIHRRIGHFTSRPVELGAQTGDRVVVKAGLKKGDQIVSSGSFMLKSELILENQDDEG